MHSLPAVVINFTLLFLPCLFNFFQRLQSTTFTEGVVLEKMESNKGNKMIGWPFKKEDACNTCKALKYTKHLCICFHFMQLPHAHIFMEIKCSSQCFVNDKLAHNSTFKIQSLTVLSFGVPFKVLLHDKRSEKIRKWWRRKKPGQKIQY